MAWAEPAQVSSKPDFRFQLSSAREVFSLLLHRPWPVKSSSTCGIASVFHRVAYFTGQLSLAREVCICYFTGQYFSVSAFKDMHELIIEPGRAEKNYWRDLWRYRELF